jgi:serine/threonine protein kinase
MGEVYRARDSRLKREVAIKVLPQALSLDADRMRRFEQEALATAALNHPNILAVFDIGENEGSPMPPAPSGETISYGPSLKPEVRATRGRNYNLQDVAADGMALRGLSATLPLPDYVWVARYPRAIDRSRRLKRVLSQNAGLLFG